MTRQDSIESALPRVGACNASKDISTTPSLTTETSLTDMSSEPAEVLEETEFHARSLTKAETTVLESDDTKSTHHQDDVGAGGVSEETLAPKAEKDSQEALLEESVQALNKDWKIGALPGDNLQLPTKDDNSQRRKSSRLHIIDRVSSMVGKTTSVLGKRSREAIEAGAEKIEALKGESKRSRPETMGQTRQNPKKRVRHSKTFDREESSSEPDEDAMPAKKKPKLWLSRGLFVGQAPDFNPRLTESKNNLKQASKANESKQANSVMPLPMFAGQRALEKGKEFQLPFDVYCPLPVKTPKPEAWKKTRKNVFFGDAAELWKKTGAQEHSLCTCPVGSSCDENCLNRHMLYECDESNCRAGEDSCTNRSFAELKARYHSKKGGLYNVGVEVFETTDRGYGIRANRTFEPNQIIVEYMGEIITQEECDRRIKTTYKNAKCFYLMDFDQTMVIDATKGSIARFVNHSCDPNCRIEKWTVAGKPRMALFAGEKGIMTGDELTYDYRFDPFSAKNVQECRCGADCCRGFLGPKPKEIKDALKPIAKGKRKVQQMMDDVVETVIKKRKIAVPTMKSAYTSVKAQTSRRLSEAGILEPSTTKPKQAIKESSKPAPKDLSKRKSTNVLGDSKKEKPKPDDSRRKSTGEPLPRGWKGWVPAPSPPPEPTEEEKAAMQEAGTKTSQVMIKSARSNEAKEVTVRRSVRGTPGKSIRVVALGEDEMKGWTTTKKS